MPTGSADNQNAEAQPSSGSRKPMSPAERARHASLVRWGKEQPFAARLEAVRQRRKAAKAKKGGGKGKAKAKDQKQDRDAMRAENREKVKQAMADADAGLSPSGSDALTGLADGKQPDSTIGDSMVARGLMEKDEQGQYHLTDAGRGAANAMDRGDYQRTLDAINAGEKRAKATAEKEKAKEEKEAKPKGGGGGGGSKEKETEEEKAAKKEQEKSENRDKVGQQLAENDADLSSNGLEALSSLSKGDAIDESLADGLVKMGLAEKSEDGSYRASTLGRQAIRAAERGDYGAVVDAVSRAKDRKAKQEKRDQEKKERQKERRQREDERRAREDERRKQEDGETGDENESDQQKPTRQTATKAQTPQERAMFANMGSSGGGGGKGGGKPTGGQGGLWKKGPDGRRTPQAGLETGPKNHDPTDGDHATANKIRDLSKRESDLTSEIRNLERQQAALVPSWGQTLKPKYRKEREAEHNRLQDEIDKRTTERAEVQRQSQEARASAAGRTSLDRVVRQEILERKRKGESRSGDDVTLRMINESLGIKAAEIDTMPNYAPLLEDLADLADELTDLAHEDEAVKAGRRHNANDQVMVQDIYEAAERICELAEALGAETGDEEEERERETAPEDDDAMTHGKSINYDQAAQLVRDAWMQQMKPDGKDSVACWPQAVFDDGIIISEAGCLYFVPYERGAAGITFAPRNEWRMARQTYITVDGEMKRIPVTENILLDGGWTKEGDRWVAPPSLFDAKAQQTFGGKEREDVPDEDFAGPQRSFPIRTADDVRDAARLIGKADDPEAVKKKIIAIAKRKGFPDAIPDAWKEKGTTKGIELFTGADGEEIATLMGDGCKAISDGDGWVGGYLVRFGGNGDLSQWRDVFDKSTDYGRHTKSDVWVHHRMLPGLGKRRLTNQAEIGMDDEGVFIKHLLDLRSSYERKLYGMVQADKLGWSSGTAPHLVERKSLGDGRHAILGWPLGLDASYTPMPAGGLGVEARAGAMKSLFADAGIDLLHAIYDDEPEEIKSISDDQARKLMLELDLLELETT